MIYKQSMIVIGKEKSAHAQALGFQYTGCWRDRAAMNGLSNECYTTRVNVKKVTNSLL